MNTLRRFAATLVGVVITCLFSAAAASAKVAPFETAAPPPDGQVTRETSGDGLLSITAMTGIGAFLLAVAVAALVARFVATHRAVPPAAHA